MNKINRILNKIVSFLLVTVMAVISVQPNNFIYAFEDSYNYERSYILENYNISPDGYVYAKKLLNQNTSGSAFEFSESNSSTPDWDRISEVLLSEKNNDISLFALADDGVQVTLPLGPFKYGQTYRFKVYEFKEGYDFSQVDQYNLSLIKSTDNMTPDVCPNPDLDPRGVFLSRAVLASNPYRSTVQYYGENGYLPLPNGYVYPLPHLGNYFEFFEHPPSSIDVLIPASNKKLVVTIEPEGILAYEDRPWGASTFIDYDRHTQFFLVEPSIIEPEPTGSPEPSASPEPTASPRPSLDQNVRKSVRVIGSTSALNYTYTTGHQKFMCLDQ